MKHQYLIDSIDILTPCHAGHAGIIRAVALCLVIASMLAGALTRAHADTHGRGREQHASMVRGTPMDQVSMHGRRFVGVRPAPVSLDTAARTPAAATLIHVLAFRGAHVSARVWTRDTGWSSQRLDARELVGVRWAETRCDSAGRCTIVTFRITGAEMDSSRNTMPAHGSNADVWLYDVEMTDNAGPGAGDWRPACAADAHGMQKGLFITADLASDGSMLDSGYLFSCTGGVIAKCVRSWGYKPWKSLRTDDGQTVDLWPLHQACVRAARADYCGDGTSYTRDGTLVDMFDVHGFNVLEHNAGFTREAGFSPDGALWVARTRWPVLGARSSGAWTALPRCARPRLEAGSGEHAVIHVFSHPRL